jgi:hypothetical protein
MRSPGPLGAVEPETNKRGSENYQNNEIYLMSDHAFQVKDKAISLLIWTGPWCYRRLRLPDFKTIGT